MRIGYFSWDFDKNHSYWSKEQKCANFHYFRTIFTIHSILFTHQSLVGPLSWGSSHILCLSTGSGQMSLPPCLAWTTCVPSKKKIMTSSNLILFTSSHRSCLFKQKVWHSLRFSEIYFAIYTIGEFSFAMISGYKDNLQPIKFRNPSILSLRNEDENFPLRGTTHVPWGIYTPLSPRSRSNPPRYRSQPWSNRT